MCLTPARPFLPLCCAPPQAKAIYRLIEALCGEVRGVAVPLVDAFAIPDHILRSPIGLRWGAGWGLVLRGHGGGLIVAPGS